MQIIFSIFAVIIALALAQPAAGQDKPSTVGQKTREVAGDAKTKTEQAAKKTGEVITDTSITAAVKTKLLADKAVSGLKIDVDTTDGVVTLNGSADTRAEAQQAVRLARNTKGVKRVVNKLSVTAANKPATQAAKAPAKKY